MKTISPKKNNTKAQDEFSAFANAFQTLEVKITSAENVTTRTPFKKGANPTVLQITEDSLVLDAPTKTCSKGHLLLLKVAPPKDPNETTDSTEVEITAKVTEINPSSDERQEISLSLVQYEELQWKNILSIYSNRQNEITEFLLQAKGLK